MKIVSMFYNFFILALFTACFYHFLFWRYLNSSMTRFSSDILLPFPNSNDLNSHELSSLIFLVWYHEVGWVFSARQVCMQNFTFSSKFPCTVRSYHVCVNVNNLPENQVYISFYNLFGACAFFADCADSKIYQPLVQCLMPARRWIKHYNANWSHNLHWNHFGSISLLLPISLDT